MTDIRPASPAQPRTLTPRDPAASRPGLILLFLCIVQSMVYLDVTIVNVALPSIQRSLDMPGRDLQFIVTAYGMMLGGFLLLGGRLAGTLGRRRLLRAGLVLFGLASLAAGLSQDQGMLIAARAVQGLGSALVAPAALSTVTTTFTEGAARNKALGIWGALAGIASVCGVLLGGLLTQGPGWRWIFFINVPIAVIAVALAPAVLPEGRDATQDRHFNTAGAITLTAGLLLLIYTLNEAVDVGWATGRTIGSLAGAAALLLAFVIIELRARSPLMPLGIFRLPTLRTANITTLLLFGAIVTLFFFASLFMQQVLGYSALKTGLAYVPLALAAAVGAGIASGLITRLPAKPVLIVGVSLAAAGLLLLSRLPVHAGYAGHVLPAFLMLGIGMGMSFVPLQIAAATGITGPQAGLAAGLINTSQEAGGALGVAIVSTIAFTRIDHLMSAAGSNPAAQIAARASGYHHAFFAGACFAGASLVLAAALLPWMKAPDGTEPAGPLPPRRSRTPLSHRRKANLA